MKCFKKMTLSKTYFLSFRRLNDHISAGSMNTFRRRYERAVIELAEATVLLGKTIAILHPHNFKGNIFSGAYQIINTGFYVPKINADKGSIPFCFQKHFLAQTIINGKIIGS